MKKTIALIIALFLLLSCTAYADELKGELVIASRNTGIIQEAYEEIFDAFMAENPGVTIEHQVITDDYENLMKAKMAANDLPDLFQTHGWSVMRYSEYLLPLNDQPWAGNVATALHESVLDDNGTIYVLPLTIDWTGILVQMDLLKELGLELPTTVEEFYNCCEKAKEAGYTGVYMAGKDTRSPAYVLDLMAPSFLLNGSDDTNEKTLLDGTFDWEKWSAVADFLATLKNNGYLNVDCATADTINFPEMLISKQTLFIFQRNSVLTNAWDIDPDANLGFFPFPAAYEGESPYMAGGESHAFGIWKDSKNVEAAKALLEYMARPENIKKMAEVIGEAPGLTGVDADMGKLTSLFSQWSETRTLPWFDRVYLPNGMWATLRDTGSAIIGGEATTADVIEVMRTAYNTLFAQK